MRRIKTILLIALTHFTLSIMIIPVANIIDQNQFDTRIRGSFIVGLVHLSGLLLSFPCALWAFSLHPANVNEANRLISALVSSIVWGSVIWLMIKMLILRRRGIIYRNRAEGGVGKE
jgi:hypothetical protein